MNNPDNQGLDIISPVDMGNAEELFSKIPTVKNTADLSAPALTDEPDIDYDNAAREFWSMTSPRQLGSYDTGKAAGRHIAHDVEVSKNIWRALTIIKSQVLSNALRSSNKSIESIRYILDVLKILDDNIEYIINSNNIKIDNNEIVAYMHGFINSVTGRKE